MKLRVQTDAARNIAVRGVLRRHGGGHRCSRCSLCKSENNVFDNFTVEMWRGPQTAWGKACSAAWENLWMAWPLSRRHVFKSDSGACVLEEVVSWTPLLNSNCERRGWIFFTGFRVGHMYHMYHTAQHNKKNMIPSLELSRRLKRIFSHHSYHSCSSGQHWSTWCNLCFVYMIYRKTEETTNQFFCVQPLALHLQGALPDRQDSLSLSMPFLDRLSNLTACKILKGVPPSRCHHDDVIQQKV